MTISPSILSIPFSNIRDVSEYKEEDEILFSMYTAFRVSNIKEIDNNDCLWQVHSTLTSQNDPQLNSLTEQIREETLLPKREPVPIQNSDRPVIGRPATQTKFETKRKTHVNDVQV
jgi:hypothetical protein